LSNTPVVSGNQQICFNSVPSSLFFSTPASGGLALILINGKAALTDLPPGPTSPAITDTYSPPALLTATYYRVVTKDAGTPPCRVVNSLPVGITVNNVLPVAVSISADVTSACEGSTVTFAVTSSSGETVPS
jgi:hypothetical protein